jgi:uncharacterized protein (TIGR02145 family)
MSTFCKIFTPLGKYLMAAILIAFVLTFFACGEVGDDASGSGSEGPVLPGTSSSSDDNEVCSGQYCCNGAEYDYKTNFCYEAELYPLCGGKTYNPYEKGCFEGKEYPKCELSSVRGICVDNGLLRCRQEGPPETHIQDAKPGMECQPNGAITGTIKDIRDFTIYKTVQINNQIWLAENLHFEPPFGNSKCQANDPDCTMYGRLYDWSTAHGLSDACNYTNEGDCAPKPGLRQAFCPPPFGMARAEDWEALVSYAGGKDKAAGRLKSSKPQNSDCPWNNNGCGNDNFNFNALPGGYAFYWGTVIDPFITSEDVFREVGGASYWWVDRQEKVEGHYWFFRTEDREARTLFADKAMNLAYVRCLHYGGD